MAIAKSKNKLQPYWFVLPEDQDSDNPTRWQIKPLTPAERESLVSFDGDRLGFHMKSYDKALQVGLIDWDNLSDEDGNPVKFSRSNMALIDDLSRTFLALEIYNNSTMDDDQKKKSSSPSK